MTQIRRGPAARATGVKLGRQAWLVRLYKSLQMREPRQLNEDCYAASSRLPCTMITIDLMAAGSCVGRQLNGNATEQIARLASLPFMHMVVCRLHCPVISCQPSSMLL